MKNKIEKITIITLLIILCLCSNFSFATFNINKADLYSKGICKTLLKMKSNGGPITVTKVFYSHEGKENPAYCINVERDGVGEHGNYSVTIDSAVSNATVWRAITNGYPYKSLADLGVQDEDEAYTATKQAVYCVLYNFDAETRYEPVGEAGERTLKALKKIVKEARENTNIKPSNNIIILPTSEWSIDENNREYISKKFKINTECNSKEFEISITENDVPDEKKEEINRILLCDLSGNEITKVNNNEFKILVPINKLDRDGTINVNVKAQLETKPVLFGNSNNASLQNYAIAGEIYEGGEGNIQINYGRNSNKLTIIKVGETDEKRLQGVEFNVLDEDGNVKYSNLQTNENGEVIIQGLFPGKYFIEETMATEGYVKLENKIEFTIDLNEELSVTVSNNLEKEEEKIEIIKNEKKYAEKKIERLPITGM